MNLAIPTWNNRVSPVFDVAATFRVFSIEASAVRVLQHIVLHQTSIEARADALKRLEVDVVVCGTISRAARRALTQRKIEVQPHICGDTEAVVESYIQGTLEEEERFVMPGCGWGGRSRCRRRGQR
ncbi:hypothetical protein KQI63_05610 [bacterium]|nr:hypothetical protein [bacterium]